MEENKLAKIYVGFITYGKSTAKYLPYFLPSLKAQTCQNIKIVAIDNSEKGDDENIDYIKNNFSEIKIERAEKNLGFAKAYNRMINKAMAEGARYFVAVNPDIILEPDAIEKMLELIESDAKIGAVQPKILKWDFTNKKKTNIIDSLGLLCDQKFRFRDDRQGQVDNIDVAGEIKDIFGFTGAAVMFNLKALKDVAFDNGEYLEYFDELMFMYKEDCDLSLRLRLGGWKIKLAGSAVVYHDRSAARFGDSIWRVIKNRQGKKRMLKIWSNWGQWIIVFKYGFLPFNLKTRFLIWWYELEIFVFMLLFEQYLLKYFLGFWQKRKLIVVRRKNLKIKIELSELEKIMK